ncbi:hypothetical protein F511_47421 [Dorcoceras hygrometricum]|uniref:Uncharacterized protein n=1 Tax=Dorcoceras hygrometricum TaxID=472368 RepID=A0A2Z6ZR24_9LAMI|nr:hypothetical protein F511_47421 [Dorcoceras hygrometricum]
MAGRSALAALLARRWHVDAPPWSTHVAQRRAHCRREFFVVAAPPPLRRCSGDVVTAGLNSSRV